MSETKKFDFTSAIDMETPIQILDDTTANNAATPPEPKTPVEEKGTKGDEKKEELIEVITTSDADELDENNNVIKNTNIAPVIEDNSSSSQNNTLHVLAKALFEEGVISSFNEEDFEENGFEAKDLISLLSNEVTTNVEGYKENLPNDIKRLIDNYEEGVPLNKLIDVRSEQITLDSIKEEDLTKSVNLQKDIIKKNLLDKGYSDVRIEKRLAQFEELEALEDEAIEALQEQKIRAKDLEDRIIADERQAALDAAEENRRQMESLKENVFSTNEIIPGLAITKKDHNKIYSSMTEIVDKDPNGNPLNSVMKTRLKNPLEFEKAVHYYHSLGLFNIDDKGKFKPDFSKISKVSKNKAIDELTRTLDGKKPLASGQPTREPYNTDATKASISALQRLMQNV